MGELPGAPWIVTDARGIHVVPGGFHVDPAAAVDTAVITHGHGDHARPGHDRVVATPETLAIMEARLGRRGGRRRDALGLSRTVRIGEVDVRFAPAGHILGSVQVVLEYRGTRVVVSGDYKRRADPTCPAFEPVACDVFVTEATFGLPVFTHPAVDDEVSRLLASIEMFPDRCHVVRAYALGKAQRLIALLRAHGHDRRVYLDAPTMRMCEVYRRFGVDLGALAAAEPAMERGLAGEVVLLSRDQPACSGLADPVTVAASGWLVLPDRSRHTGVELPLVISDHADWTELHRTFHDVGASRILATHGRTDALVHRASRDGIAAGPLPPPGGA